MNTTTHTPTGPAIDTATVTKSNAFARVPAAFRLHFAVPSMLIAVPALVFFVAWGIAVAIVAAIHAASADASADDPTYTGAAQATLWCLGFMAAYSGSHTFPFSLALSFSRRTFVLGTLLAFLVVSTTFGAASAAMAALERATDGFWINAYVFDLPYLTEGAGNNFITMGLASALICLAVMIFGFTIVLLYLRLGLAKLWTVILSVAVLLAAGAILITANGQWGDVWQWIVQLNSTRISGWMLLVVAIQSVVAYLVIRQATPRG